MSDAGARLRRTLATAFGIGRVPVAPGTAASIAAFLVAVALPANSFPRWAITIAVTASIVGIVVGMRAHADFGVADPPAFVMDEVAGYFVSIVRAQKPGILELVAALVLFRVFDVWKPFPVRQAERLPGGFGIVLDDLLAGGYTAALLMLIHRALPSSA